ncbi:MAG TPA: DUF5522 domain-containing protein [Chitinophagales bacterium]|nr:hypothetical protein [Chitinophagales bacterium]HMX05082.1 DUF5522 domain-containing protein [Chitinophagales bacterium]HMZ90447.1 DUF5522 domain-containing protein [Chitinophagales bacterium]HNA58733.1 DUF5522 domain-containing protein [Chitinophagales bacterium]HNE47436.1 DUF5522 domain-containing protein [Chitinophagales bacterium]
MSGGKLIEGEDYYINAEGLFVFTAAFLLKRGFCCGNGCAHCPYPKSEENTYPVEEKKP